MKNRLRYQISDFDCGPTTLLNGFSFLFEREEIPPDLIRDIYTHSLDGYGPSGIRGSAGTSAEAMKYLAFRIHHYGLSGKLPVDAEFLSKSEVTACPGESSALLDTLHNGDTAVVRVFCGCGHYILLTGEKDGNVYAFDPYFREEEIQEPGVIHTNEHPLAYNYVIPLSLLNRDTEEGYFGMGSPEHREALLLHRTDRRQSA